MKNRAAAIIVAAGTATRFGAPKLLTPIGGSPAIEWSLRTFSEHPLIDSIVVVVSESLRAEIANLVRESSAHAGIELVTGGVRRQDSVLAGLAALNAADIVVIHDGARPLVTSGMITAVINAVSEGADAAITAVPVTDTVKRLSGGMVSTVDRSDLWRAQTPQAFRMRALKDALFTAEQQDWEVTDEAVLIERTGGRIAIVPGDERNIKLTVPTDAIALNALIREEQTTLNRTGIGYDVHRLVSGRRLILGGVEIPFDRGLDGHSDADVLCHAISDALLGACALGDIGTHFPPSDEAYRGISSIVLLERVRELVSASGGVIDNVDAMVVAEAPKIGPYVREMQEKIASALAMLIDRVGVKATTNEGLGFAGRGEGIAAMATAHVQVRSR